MNLWGSAKVSDLLFLCSSEWIFFSSKDFIGRQSYTHTETETARECWGCARPKPVVRSFPDSCKEARMQERGASFTIFPGAVSIRKVDWQQRSQIQCPLGSERCRQQLHPPPRSVGPQGESFSLGSLHISSHLSSCFSVSSTLLMTACPKYL